jgi:hypothetical protein
MRLFAILLAAAAATSVLSGCGNTYYYSAEEVRELGAVRRAAEPRAAASIRTVRVAPKSVGARSSENSAHRPWPEVGSAEAQEIVAQQDLREKRIQEMVHGICRGC